MERCFHYDGRATPIEWAHDGVTARRIDGFRSNLEKGFRLWRPEPHEPLRWAIPRRQGAALGAVHNAPQTWDDGRRQDLFIRFERLEELAPDIRDVISREPVMIVAGLGFDEAAIAAAHAAGEIGNRPVSDPGRNPFTDLSVEGAGRRARRLAAHVTWRLLACGLAWGVGIATACLASFCFFSGSSRRSGARGCRDD